MQTFVVSQTGAEAGIILLPTSDRITQAIATVKKSDNIQ